MLKKTLINTCALLILNSCFVYASTPAPKVTTNPMDGQPLPTTQQLINQCENNTGAANCPQIVKQGETRFQDQQQSLHNQINALPNQTSNIPDQPGPGSNPLQQPNYPN